MKKLSLTLVFTLAACTSAQSNEQAPTVIQQAQTSSAMSTTQASTDQTDTAIFAGGCFWCIESDFEKLPGVISVVSGYSGGQTENPTYKQVTHKETGHYEVVKVTYDVNMVSYDGLLDYFWRHIDPTDPRGQFCDKGSSYRSAIFATPEQFKTATESKAEIERIKPFKADIVTPVLPASTFYKAEDYHQDYYKKNPAHYQRYRNGCGRDRRVQQLWGDK